ncbi:uncharacterized protein M421DRAFT_415812 [Didymella exigua CBS 183.55]|uniref:Wings apart-like protein C-terminal domain-containing protein n=1 Tax=Didymella exigua CBS 183.55 TaxID=1150837 RepID=A0A6A5S0S7_9PLEO|nr:uncharacterized protein M421DRAFT_415812 [Didymella exigua CBS 183.55]KAF1933473.1 hypothetical protein M421DRAFT_415812 [Didymella exigua CBS 183.55]
MASSMSSTFTTGERRKKVITYGKLSRLPPPRQSLLEDDAPSPERPHKYTAPSSGPSAEYEGLTKSVRPSAHARAVTTSPDVFDVPSEDEFGFPSTPPAKRSVIQRSKTERVPRANVVKKPANVPGRTATTAPRPPQKSAIAKPAEVKTRVLQEQIRMQRLMQDKDTQARIQPANKTSQAKASRATVEQRQVGGGGQRLQRSITSSKDASRATTPDIVPQPMPKSQSVRATTSVILRKTAKPATKQPVSLDVFDVPSDEEAASLPIPAAPRQTSRSLSKVKAKQPESRNAPSFDLTRKPSELGNLHNRKRKGSESLATVPSPASEPTQEVARLQRDRKIPKRQTGTSPGLESTKAPAARPELQATFSESVINKPKRTRTRTVPVVSQPAMFKGQSSPAVLHKMLQATKSSYEDSSEVPASDDTMYDISDPVTTPIRPRPSTKTTASTPGSVTPRQKDLFSTLLGGTAAPKTPASALAALQLTDKKPRSLLGALARSKSDVAYSSQSRKTRLIDTLKDDDTSSEDEGSESDEEADSSIITTLGVDNDKTPVQTRRMVVEEASEDDIMNEKAAGDSQTSQISSGVTTRPRLTYATQRSYLQEANPEDEFLMSMEMDDTWNMDSHTVSTDDEDGPTSQPRTYHELKKYGQNTMFSWDMEESIREISDASNRSGRRSAMMDLCTKMADAGFISQLLDSGFMHRLLENIVTPTDPIFDFIAAVSVLFILQTKPTFAVVDQIHQSGITTTLLSLVDKDTDISRVARDRKSNMSKIAQDSLADFLAVVLAAKAWSSSTPEKVSPQIVALTTIDLLVQSLRESGSTDALLTPTDVSKVVNACSFPSSRIKAAKASPQDMLVLDLAISVLETVSIVDQDYSTWPTKTLQQLSEVISVFFESGDLTKTVEAMKLCMNLTNNKSKACQPFSTRTFLQPLIHFLVSSFKLLNTGTLEEDRQAALTLSLGAIINLAELSDQARLNAVANTNSIEELVRTYIVGSERAAQATSVEESEVGVKINFLGVLLGMLCLNATVRSKVQVLLPGQQLKLLLQNMRVFARIHETVDEKTARRFEGAEGQEALNNYYVRIMHVVEKLEGAKA